MRRLTCRKAMISIHDHDVPSPPLRRAPRLWVALAATCLFIICAPRVWSDETALLGAVSSASTCAETDVLERLALALNARSNGVTWVATGRSYGTLMEARWRVVLDGEPDDCRAIIIRAGGEEPVTIPADLNNISGLAISVTWIAEASVDGLFSGSLGNEAPWTCATGGGQQLGSSAPLLRAQLAELVLQQSEDSLRPRAPEPSRIETLELDEIETPDVQWLTSLSIRSAFMLFGTDGAPPEVGWAVGPTAGVFAVGRVEIQVGVVWLLNDWTPLSAEWPTRRVEIPADLTDMLISGESTWGSGPWRGLLSVDLGVFLSIIQTYSEIASFGVDRVEWTPYVRPSIGVTYQVGPVDLRASLGYTLPMPTTLFGEETLRGLSAGTSLYWRR